MANERDMVTKELVAIKRLLVLALLKSGLTQTEVAAALEIDRSGISKMFPKGTLSVGDKKVARSG